MTNIGSYTKQVIKNFTKPKNFGKMKNPDGIGEVGNIVCGDVMYLYIKVSQNKKGQDIISDITFQTYGCVAAIATSSMITRLAKGKTLEEALKISKEDVVKSLGGLPRIKVHCSVLAVDALLEAVHDYLKKANKPISEDIIQKHLVLEKEKKDIEERYKDWIGAQKNNIKK